MAILDLHHELESTISKDLLITNSMSLSFSRYSMAKKFADLTAQVKTEKRFSRRLDYPTTAAPTSVAERLSPAAAVATSSARSSASSSPSSVSRVTVGAPPPPQVVVVEGQQQMRAQFHVHHEHLVSSLLSRTFTTSHKSKKSWCSQRKRPRLCRKYIQRMELIPHLVSLKLFLWRVAYLATRYSI